MVAAAIYHDAAAFPKAAGVVAGNIVFGEKGIDRANASIAYQIRRLIAYRDNWDDGPAAQDARRILFDAGSKLKKVLDKLEASFRKAIINIVQNRHF